MIGEETKAQILEREGRLPDAVIACVGGGSNAIGMFADFINETDVGLIGVEPGGHGIETGEHGAPLKHGRVGIYFGMKAPMMQTEDGQVKSLTPFLPGWISRPSARNMRISTALDALITCLLPTMKPWKPLKRFACMKGSSRRWNPPTPWPMR